MKPKRPPELYRFVIKFVILPNIMILVAANMSEILSEILFEIAVFFVEIKYLKLIGPNFLKLMYTNYGLI